MSAIGPFHVSVFKKSTMKIRGILVLYMIFLSACADRKHDRKRYEEVWPAHPPRRRRFYCGLLYRGRKTRHCFKPRFHSCVFEDIRRCESTSTAIINNLHCYEEWQCPARRHLLSESYCEGRHDQLPRDNTASWVRDAAQGWLLKKMINVPNKR